MVGHLTPFLIKKTIRAQDLPDYESMEVLGVSNQIGITVTDHKKSKDLSKYQLIEEGDFAYNPYRINVGSIGLVPKGKRGLVSPAYVVFTTTDDLLPELLFDYLKSVAGQFQISKFARGTVRKALRFEDLCKISMSVPSIEDQRRILTKKNSIEFEVSELKSELTHQQTLLKKLRQQILQEAIEGKLTADWRDANPDVEPASELLKRITAEKELLVKDKKIKPRKPLSPISDDEKLFELPEGWAWCRLDNIIDDLLGGYAFKSPLFKKVGNKQVLRLGNIRPYTVRFNEKPVFIDDDVASDAYKAKLNPGDLLITMTGTRGKRDYCYSVLLREEHFQDRDLYLNQRVGCFRFNRNINLNYQDYCLKNDTLLNQIFSTATGAANQANIGSTTLRSWIVPLPPLPEQKAIVAKVEKLLALCDQLEAQIGQNKTHVEQLMQTVLKEAFSHNASPLVVANILEGTSFA